MNSLEAALHFGVTRKPRPGAGAIRDLFLATVDRATPVEEGATCAANA